MLNLIKIMFVSLVVMSLASLAFGHKGIKGTFYYVQNSAWHPVHQLTQQAFLEGCRQVGIKCKLATTDENALDALVALADQTISRSDAAGVAMWAGGLPVFKKAIKKANAKGIPIVLPHFPVAEGFFADNAVQIAADPTDWPIPLAQKMCDEVKRTGGKGSVAITINNHNVTEDAVARVFAGAMKKYCPHLKILEVQEEGPEPTKAIQVATSIMLANPDVVAALSTTGGGPTTWAGAQKETGRKIIAVGMDYTRVNLDLVKSGQVWGAVAQPLYTECLGAAKLLMEMANGAPQPYWTKLEAPLITKENVDDYYGMLDRLEPNYGDNLNKNPDS